MATKTFINGGVDSYWGTSGNWNPSGVPTYTDDVVFDASSPNCTINAEAYCYSINMSLYTGTLTHNAFILYVGPRSADPAGGGNIDLSGSWTYTAATASYIATSAAVGGTCYYNFGTKNLGHLLIGNYGGRTPVTVVELQSNITANIWANFASITLSIVKLNTNGYNLTAYRMNFASGTINAGSSTFTINGTTNSAYLTINASNTFNAGTSSIVIAGTSATFSGGGKTFNNFTITGGGTHEIAGANTFADFTVTGTAVKTNAVYFKANQTITGTLTLTGNSAINRLFLYSDTYGTARTLTAATVSCDAVDFMDIAGAGAGNWDLSTVPNYSGNCLGNSGITFTPSQTCTWTNTSGGNWDTLSNWSGTIQRIPLAHDTVSMACAFTTNRTVSTNGVPRLGGMIDWSGATFTTSLTWAFSSAGASIFSSVTFKAGMTTSQSNSGINYHSRGIVTIKTNNITQACASAFSGTTGSVFRIDGDLNLPNTDSVRGYLTVTPNVYLDMTNAGTANNNLTCTFVDAQVSSGIFINMGTGTFKFQGGYLRKFENTNFTVRINAHANRLITNTGDTPSLNLNNVVIEPNAYTLSFSSQNGVTFKSISMSSAGTKTVIFPSTKTITLTGQTFLQGTSGSNITIQSDTAGSAFILKNDNYTIETNYITLKDCTASSTTGKIPFYAGANSTNVSGNTNWLFTNKPPSGNVLNFGGGI